MASFNVYYLEIMIFSFDIALLTYLTLNMSDFLGNLNKLVERCGFILFFYIQGKEKYISNISFSLQIFKLFTTTRKTRNTAHDYV